MLKLIKNFTKKEWILALICLVLVVTQVWLELKMPDYMSEITKLVQTEGSQMKDILVNGGYMLTCALGSLVAAVITGYITSRISSNFSKTIRKKLFNKVEDLAMQEVKQFSTSSLITRTTNDITQIEMLIAMGLQLLIKAPITAIWAITKILNKSWQWSAITAVAVAILMTTIAIIMVIVLPRFKKVQKLIDKLNGVTRENLTGIRVVRAFNAEQYQEEKFDKANNNLTNQQLFNQKVFAVMQPMMYIIMYMVILSIYYVGAYLIKDAGMADKISLFGDMVVFSSYAMQVIMSFLMLAMIFMMLPRAQVSANRINEVLDTEISIKDGKININGQNFRLDTAIVADDVISKNYIDSDTKEINFVPKVENGTQKLIEAKVKSKIKNINDYSRNDNTVVFSGIFVYENEDGNEVEVPLNKTCNLTIDWYGTSTSKITT